MNIFKRKKFTKMFQGSTMLVKLPYRKKTKRWEARNRKYI